MTPWSEYSKTCRAKVKNGMTAEELKVKRLPPGFRSLHALPKALGVSKYAIEHWEYSRRAIPNWVPRFLQCLERLAGRSASE